MSIERDIKADDGSTSAQSTTQELFLTAGKYITGSVLSFDQHDVVLERLLELSPSFMRYKVTVHQRS